VSGASNIDSRRRAAGLYADQSMRLRMLEYYGGDSLQNLTCEYLTAGDKDASHHRQPLLTAQLPALWSQGLDISRSLWDRRSLIFHLDIDYVNFDCPAAHYLNLHRVIELQRHVEWVVEAVLSDYGIKPLHLLSGRGHHYVWRIAKAAPAFRQLAGLRGMPPSLGQFYARPHRPHQRKVPAAVGRAFFGAGLVREYLAHRIKELVAPMCEIPVELTAVEVGPTCQAREMISIDISEYGDPLSSRVIRVPFSVYLKPLQQRSWIGKQTAEELPPMFLIPLEGIDSPEGAVLMRDAAKVARLASRTSTLIPEQPAGMNELIRAYRHSSVAQYHRWFYSQEPHPPKSWPQTYDLLSMENLPCCARHILEHPNDLLLRPAGVQRIVRVLLSLGWHPRHIAGLIRSKFERGYGWGGQWNGYDPWMRADFYTRVFAGLFVAGRDDLVDFNCRSAREEQFCFVPNCTNNLEPFRNSLLDRRKYERLACRPFNRLFLPAEHL